MLVPIILILLASIVTFGTPCCEQKERISYLLDSAIEFLSKAKSENITCPGENDFTCAKALDCADLYERGNRKSGVYSISPISRLTSMKSIDVYCDMTTDGGGWTVIQRRGDFGRADDYFNQDWENYKKGFGDIKRDFWFGNDKIFAMTNQRLYSVRFDLEDMQQKRVFAHYDKFWIDDESNKYMIHISDYRGNANDSMKYHNNMKFTTKDQDNDLDKDGNCGVLRKSGWWFRNCYVANLNGMYNNYTNGINWNEWKRNIYLPKAEIKIRPTIFRNSK